MPLNVIHFRAWHIVGITTNTLMIDVQASQGDTADAQESPQLAVTRTYLLAASAIAAGSSGRGPPSGALAECVKCAKDFWRAPGAVSCAVGEFDDHTGFHERVDVSTGIAGSDPEFR
jgi:hypothetical protein